jgi:type I restriction enzyme R subunit
VTTDTTERGLEALILRAMTGRTDVLVPLHIATKTSVPVADGTGWLLGDAAHYDREFAVDIVQLCGFLEATQPLCADALLLGQDGATRRAFLARLQGEIAKRGTIDVLRNGVKHGAYHIDLFYGSASAGNVKAAELFAENRFSVTRQLRYSRDERQLALDLGLFINGLPVATLELKNNLTKQTVADAVEQYKRNRDPRERLFAFGRCIAHFAVDDQEVRFCTHLKGKQSWFLPFNRGWQDGAGNPPNPGGIKTDYLWREILTLAGLTDIIENYAQVVVSKDANTGKRSGVQIFPRFHQLDVVRKLLADVAEHGAGRRYLIQHSPGSGKSNSIAWLVHQLIGLESAGQPVLDSVIVVTDRKVLDKQLRDTIKQFAQVRSTIGVARHSGDLRNFLDGGKKIIITTIQKFPFVLEDIGNDHRDRKFGIVIDEAHSSQSGSTAAALNEALAKGGGKDEEEDPEDRINRIMEARKMLPNASYFAFTATPKNKTLENFGEPFDEDGTRKRRAFHSYTMKQAIQEDFIVDVLASYTQVRSYYKLISTVDGDPEFDARRASKKLRRYVESNDHAISLKAEIMVDHFHDQVIDLSKIGGEARAMVVTDGVERAIQYFHAIQAYLRKRKSPYKVIVAFSGEPEYRGAKVTESSLNGFPSERITDEVRKDPYRLLVCADKFQTGYDEPLMHSMYVDKRLSGIKAVQTLSRLNRAHPKKHDAFVLDFMNDTDEIQLAFSAYYRTTVLSEETDPNRLHDLQANLEGAEIYSQRQVDAFADLYLGNAPREQLDPILDSCVAIYNEELDEDGQVEFKGYAKAFTRSYGFLASILPYSSVGWEKLSIFLNFLIPKLPAPREDDLSRGILETIDMDSYRVERQKAMQIALADEDGSIGPVPTSRGGRNPEPELDRLSSILKAFNDQFGDIEWTDADRVRRLIVEEIPTKVAADRAYRNARRNNDEQNARIEHDKALERVMNALLKDDTELFKQFSDNESFRRWLTDSVFAATYDTNSGDYAS